MKLSSIWNVRLSCESMSLEQLCITEGVLRQGDQARCSLFLLEAQETMSCARRPFKGAIVLNLRKSQMLWWASIYIYRNIPRSLVTVSGVQTVTMIVWCADLILKATLRRGDALCTLQTRQGTLWLSCFYLCLLFYLLEVKTHFTADLYPLLDFYDGIMIAYPPVLSAILNVSKFRCILNSGIASRDCVWSIVEDFTFNSGEFQRDSSKHLVIL